MKNITVSDVRQFFMLCQFCNYQIANTRHCAIAYSGDIGTLVEYGYYDAHERRGHVAVPDEMVLPPPD